MWMKAPRQVVLITGASAGLGESLARELVRRGKARALVLTARRLEDLIDFVVGRVCDQLGIHNALSPRWGDVSLSDPDETRWDTKMELEETHPELFEEL